MPNFPGTNVVNVTKTYLPEKGRLYGYFDQVYQSGWVTNDGAMVRRLEERLTEYLGVPYIVPVANGTLALQIAYRALGIRGSAVTSPFSFVATTSSLVWEGVAPRFGDIDAESMTLDPATVEAQINPETTAVVPVHVYGNCCDVETIGRLAEARNLRVIYDAAHSFGVKYLGKSILNFGDASTLSFHATKLFHTTEGGAVVVRDEGLYREIKSMINFGIKRPDAVEGFGINAKMNEFQAAMGLAVLDEIDLILEARRAVAEAYRASLPKEVLCPMLRRGSDNYSYFPILFASRTEAVRARDALLAIGVHTRRYFYPSLDTLPYVSGQAAPVSRDIASRVLCLPMYAGLVMADVTRITDAVNGLAARPSRVQPLPPG